MKNKGFTLIEVIVAIAILGILAVTFIPMLSNQYLIIMKSGRKSEATYNTIDEIEKKLIEKEKEKEENKNNNKYFPKKTTKIDVRFNHGKQIELQVDHMESEVKYGNEKIKIDLGIPIE